MLSTTLFQANVARNFVRKLQLWSIKLTEYNFTVEYIPDENNVCTDMVTRWAAPVHDKDPARRFTIIKVHLITKSKQEFPSV